MLIHVEQIVSLILKLNTNKIGEHHFCIKYRSKILINFFSHQFLVSEMVLRYCDNPATGTCCTYSVEMKLASTSRAQLEKNTKESIGKLSSVLGTRAAKFNGKCKHKFQNFIFKMILSK